MFRLTLAALVALPLVAFSQPAKPKADDGPTAEADDGTRVTLAFDPGSHSRPISAVGFSKDRRKLITVGWDYSVRTWNTATGAPIDHLRLPPYGRDNGPDASRWEVAAVSADGRFVAVGGAAKLVWNGGKAERCQLVVIDVEAKKVRRAITELAGGRIKQLAFSADGERLVYTADGDPGHVGVLDGVSVFMADDKKEANFARFAEKQKREFMEVAVSPSGRRCAFAAGGQVFSWDISGTDPKKWKQLGSVNPKGRNQAMAWSPDDSRMVRGWMEGTGNLSRGLEVHSPDLKSIKNYTQADLSPGFAGQSVTCTIQFLDADRVFVSAHGVIARRDAGGGGAFGAVVNLKDGTSKRLYGDAGQGMFTPFGAAAGDLAATTTDKGLVAAVYRLDDGKVVSTCGNTSPLPRVVGWAKDPKAPAVAWADKETLLPFTATPADLTSGFDLTAVGPLAALKPADFQMRSFGSGDWKLEYKLAGGTFTDLTLKKAGDSKLEVRIDMHSRSATLIPRGSGPPLVATAKHDAKLMMGNYATLWDADGKKVTDWLPTPTDARDMAPSPDGRFVVMATGTHRLSVYRTDGSRFPMLNLATVNGEWVVWTPEGYYAASPGGERMIGWVVGRGPNAFAEFLPADKYAKHFRRPDVIRLALEKGSVKEALEALKASSAPAVETILPPEVKLTVLGQTGGKVKVRAEAVSAKGKPVLMMKVMVNGKPHAQGQGVWDPGGPQPAVGEFDIDVPPGLSELSVLARNEDVSASSARVAVRGPKEATDQPALHRVCVGVNEYANPDQRLQSAAKDAKAMYAALGEHCVGTSNRYRAGEAVLLLDKDVTRDGVLAALAKVRKAARPGDLVVVFSPVTGRSRTTTTTC